MSQEISDDLSQYVEAYMVLEKEQDLYIRLLRILEMNQDANGLDSAQIERIAFRVQSTRKAVRTQFQNYVNTMIKYDQILSI